MNKIEVKGNTKNKEFNLLEDTIIFYENCTCKINYKTSKNIKIFECISNSNVTSNYDINEDLILNIFSVDSSVDITINLNKESINLDYAYSTLNIKDNNYKININHNNNNEQSKITNHGINLESNKLDFLVNTKVPNTSNNTFTSQDSKIITLKDNNSSIKPNLLIDNYEAYANHSAYIGDFKTSDLFYLTSRGITLESSRKLLAKSFLIGNMNISFKEINIILDKLNTYWR